MGGVRGGVYVKFRSNTLKRVDCVWPLQAEFEALFRRLDPGVEFHYLSGLRRVRVGFQTVAKATAAQEQLNNNKTNMGLACHFLPVGNFFI